MDVEESLLSPFPSPPRNRSPASSIDSFEPVVLTGRTDTMVSTRANAEQPDATIQTPKLGGTFKSDVVWIGGPPKADFSGPFLGAPPTPLCLRNLDAASEIKGYIRRTSGHSVKFKRNDPDFGLMAFADVALQHMQATGMDTVSHMKGVDSDGEGGQELFTFHTRYSKAAVDKFIAEQIGNGVFDKLQKDALTESATWLVDSLDESLKSSLRTHLAKRPNGPQLWMLIVGEVQSDSLNRCDELAERFKKLTLASFKGENVRDYATEAGHLLTQLERDEQLPRTHLKKIVDVFSACTVDDFRVHWMGRRAAVQKFIKDSAGKSKEAIEAMPNFIHFNHLLDEGKEEFLNLKDQWGPAKTAGTSPTAMLSNLTTQVAQLNQQLKAKTPAGSNGGGGGGDDPKKGIHCFKCGEPGFTKKNCPKCKANANGGGNGDDSKTEKPGPSNNGSKWDAPKPGESHEKMINGVLHHWCAKCRGGKGRWNKNHKTDKHQTGFFKAQRDEAAGASAHIAETVDQDLFSAWADRF